MMVEMTSADDGRTPQQRNPEAFPVLSEALIREDGRVLYPVDDGIPVMLVEESIEV